MQSARSSGRLILEEPRSQSKSLFNSPNSAGSTESGIAEDGRHKKANFAVLAALQAMKVDTSIGFTVLTNADHLFLLRTPARPPHLSGNILRTSGLKVYEVINQTGHRLYFAVVLPRQCLRTFWLCPNSFVAYIVDSFGDEIFRIEADSGFYGNNSVVVARSSTDLFGRVTQEGDCCTPDYTLTNSDDDPLIKVRPSQSVNCFNLCVPVDYVVFHGELASRIGKMNTNWYNTGVLPEFFHSPHVKLYGINFPRETDITSKVLLLTTLLMVKIFRNEF